MTQNLDEWVFSIYGQETFRPGLDRINKAISPFKAKLQKSRIITIAGTNGKGETTHRLSKYLKNDSYCTWTSPHIHQSNERFSSENGDISDDDIKIPEAASKKQVFHVPDNKYTYDDAKAICKAYDARLATYKEISESYDKGADWCGYGWSDGQMALYPTQFDKWQNLQKIPGHEHDCGRPGINGGYMANTNNKYGVNCYGKKPAASDADKNRMNANKNRVYPKTNEDALLDAKVQFWKNNSDKLLKINSFNNDKWSEF
jgi:hypothetical protein